MPVKLILIATVSFLFISCSDNSPDSYDDGSLDYVENKNNDSDWDDDCENSNDCDSMDDADLPDTEGHYSLTISDGYFGSELQGNASITSVAYDDEGVKTTGFQIFLYNDDQEQSSVETFSITLLRIGDESGQLQVDSYPLINSESGSELNKYGSFSFITSDMDVIKNTEFVEGVLTINKAEKLEYEISNAVNMNHDVTFATVSVTMNDKVKSKTFTIQGEMRLVTVGKMSTN